MSSDDSHVLMRVEAVVLDPESKAPVLILRSMEDAGLFLPIFIGHLEATAIATFIAGMEMPRPMTHDLCLNLLEETGWTLESVTVTRLEESTFYAELELTNPPAEPRRVDARPSDSIAIALRAGVDIRVARSVLDQAGGRQSEDDPAAPLSTPPPEQAPAPILDGTTKLEDMDPELFSKYKM